MACQTTRHYTVCVHVIEGNAEPIIYQHEGDAEDAGSILCAVCDPISQSPGGWSKIFPFIRLLCSDCCRQRWMKEVR